MKIGSKRNVKIHGWDKDGDRTDIVQFEVLDFESWGPSEKNPIYGFGRWEISRHLWELPEHRWAWRAMCPGRPTVYQDTLADMAMTLRGSE